jgi:hypothetical protein
MAQRTVPLIVGQILTDEEFVPGLKALTGLIEQQC